MIDGYDGHIKANVYKHQGSRFILYQFIESEEECINLIQQDGTIAVGIFIQRIFNDILGFFENMIGTHYLPRSGRWEGRVYRNNRISNSGDIKYEDKIKSKDDSSLRTQAESRFNRETLEWIKYK